MGRVGSQVEVFVGWVGFRVYNFLFIYPGVGCYKLEPRATLWCWWWWSWRTVWFSLYHSRVRLCSNLKDDGMLFLASGNDHILNMRFLTGIVLNIAQYKKTWTARILRPDRPDGDDYLYRKCHLRAPSPITILSSADKCIKYQYTGDNMASTESVAGITVMRPVLFSSNDQLRTERQAAIKHHAENFHLILYRQTDAGDRHGRHGRCGSLQLTGGPDDQGLRLFMIELQAVLHVSVPDVDGQSINQSIDFLTWPKQRTAKLTSRTTRRKRFAVRTAKRWDRDRTDENRPLCNTDVKYIWWCWLILTSKRTPRYEHSQSSAVMVPVTPNSDCRRSISREWSTVSNAADRSTCRPLPHM